MVPCPAIQVPFLCQITRFPCICISSYNQLTSSTKNLGKWLNRAMLPSFSPFSSTYETAKGEAEWVWPAVSFEWLLENKK
jgi:hypothetical protein